MDLRNLEFPSFYYVYSRLPRNGVGGVHVFHECLPTSSTKTRGVSYSAVFILGQNTSRPLPALPDPSRTLPDPSRPLPDHFPSLPRPFLTLPDPFPTPCPDHFPTLTGRFPYPCIPPPSSYPMCLFMRFSPGPRTTQAVP